MNLLENSIGKRARYIKKELASFKIHKQIVFLIITYRNITLEALICINLIPLILIDICAYTYIHLNVISR